MGRQDFFLLIRVLLNYIPNAFQQDVPGLTIEEKVGIILYRLGHGASYDTVGHVFIVGKTTVYQVSKSVVQAILEALHDSTIIFPAADDVEKWAEIKESFRLRQGLRNIIGAIDGTHIPIIPPANDQWNAYVNRKGWHSIVFQCIVDAHGNFCNVYGGLPGSLHDSRVFRKSQIGQDLINGVARFPADCLLIGDSGYSSRLPILVPSRNPHNEEGAHFNNIHSSTRIVVEQAFGRLKNRFRCLLTPQAIVPLHAVKVTIACMILHNVLNGHQCNFLDNWNRRNTQEERLG
ncbi:hypothetical protein O181_034266 [Austropuccinia psidii MF-1]|uniref:DDE Tnp4 domain-containing protein n=1 Tax=Austropuccinia psidii MF-1 TaxID=1389203 RepID=A0A9Q3D0C6_9BASI|nr:hypothetical protein [Austropuccinia psidii MF-1]